MTASGAAALARPRALLSWSSGKDSAWALHVLRQRGEVEIVGLLTTVNERYGRVAMHAVRQELLEMQARATGLPLWPVPIPSPCTNEQYEAAMTPVLDRALAEGVTVMAFGDLFLEDIRRYREERLAPLGISAIFPLWGLPTAALARDMIHGGLQAHITCVDPRSLSSAFAGRSFDIAFLADLPPTVDPCGERGEFHTFACAGPMFDRALSVWVGDVVKRDGFVFAGLRSFSGRTTTGSVTRWMPISRRNESAAGVTDAGKTASASKMIVHSKAGNLCDTQDDRRLSDSLMGQCRTTEPGWRAHDVRRSGVGQSAGERLPHR